LTGGGFRDWSDRVGNVEELLEMPDLRNELAGIRDRARVLRSDFVRHSKEPEWDLVRSQVLEPLVQVRDRLREELARRQSSEALVPIDRDPVPPRFAEQVRRYYEQLGRSTPQTETSE
jgi:hypothetical protein